MPLCAPTCQTNRPKVYLDSLDTSIRPILIHIISTRHSGESNNFLHNGTVPYCVYEFIPVPVHARASDPYTCVQVTRTRACKWPVHVRAHYLYSLECTACDRMWYAHAWLVIELHTLLHILLIFTLEWVWLHHKPRKVINAWCSYLNTVVNSIDVLQRVSIK